MSESLIKLTYNGNEIVPVPIITFQREAHMSANLEQPYGFTQKISLDGTIVGSGLVDTMSQIQTLKNIFAVNGARFEIMCDDTLVFAVYARISDMQFEESSNNWVMTVPFSIELEYDDEEDLLGLPLEEVEAKISAYSENWSFDFSEDVKQYVWNLSLLNNQDGDASYPEQDSNSPFEGKVSRNISITGKQSWINGNYVSGVENAQLYIRENLDLSYNSEFGHAVIGLTNLTISGDTYNVFDHYRSHSTNHTDGTLSISDNWLVLAENSGFITKGFREEFNINTSTSLEDNKVNISIDGQIQGFEQRTYDVDNAITNNPVTVTAYTNAESAWGEIQSRLFSRSQKIFQAEGRQTKLNPKPLSLTLGHSPTKGIITYNCNYNDRPCNFISGSLVENISIVDNNPADVFASIPVLGRPQGPVLQEIGTFTSPTREISIEVVMPTPTGCNFNGLQEFNPKTQVQELLCSFETDLSSSSDQIFKTGDSENWNPLNGRYSRTIGWIYATCSGEIRTPMCAEE